MKVTDFGIARADDERAAHQDRRGDRHRHLLLARAGAGLRARRPLRRVRARRRALRDAHRRRAVHRREPGVGRVQARARDAGAAVVDRARPARRDGPHRAHRDGEGRRRALPVGRRTCAPTCCASSAAAPLVGAPATASTTAVARPRPRPSMAAAPPRRPAAAADPAPTPARAGAGARSIAIGIALALLVALIVVLLVQRRTSAAAAAPSPTVDVPSVVGMQYGAGRGDAQGLGLHRGSATDVERARASPPTSCSRRTPKPGRKVAKGGAITLQVSSATIPMPNVVGQTRDAGDADPRPPPNLTPQLRRGRTATSHRARSSRTDPAAGAPVAKLAAAAGRPVVTVIVAREPMVPVPDVSQPGPDRRGRDPRRRPASR